jgi:hypothetical protein
VLQISDLLEKLGVLVANLGEVVEPHFQAFQGLLDAFLAAFALFIVELFCVILDFNLVAVVLLKVGD